MNCQEFESTLNEVLDDRKDPSEYPILIDHSNECEDCNEVFGIYASIAEYSHSVESQDSQAAKSRWRSAYVLGATAAAVLLLLSPVGALWNNNEPDVINLAQWESSQHALQIESNDSVQSSKTDNGFWTRRPLANMVSIENISFPETPNLQNVGKSINSVWESIKEDEFLLPIIRQGALIWVQST